MTRKFVTIYLDTAAYLEGKWVAASFADRHGAVEEHLADHLRDGRRVASVGGLGGASDAVHARGRFAVVLEK